MMWANFFDTMTLAKFFDTLSMKLAKFLTHSQWRGQNFLTHSMMLAKFFDTLSMTLAKFFVVRSVSLTCNNWDFDKRFTFISLHDMFRRLAPCSRGGFYKNGKLSNVQQTYLCPQEKWKWGQRFTKIPMFKKNLGPNLHAPLSRAPPCWVLTLFFSSMQPGLAELPTSKHCNGGCRATTWFLGGR